MPGYSTDLSLTEAEQIYLQASEQSSNGRTDYVRRQTGNNIDLYQEVMSLLSASAGSESYFDSFMNQVVETVDAPVIHQIGHYTIVQQIGCGGMGEVYLAERNDGQFEKQVAIKLLSRAHTDPSGLERFRQERQILAGLVHPNICRLLDGGVTDQGVLYFVMDHVDGQPVDRYCQDNELSVQETLEVFEQVCDAVSYAHANLVLHRDLKPGNILVDAQGQVQLLDFGVGQFYTISEGDDDHDEDRVPITPNYASPELIQATQATVRSDIYSLGVTLYRLLTGVLPHRQTGLPLMEYLNILITQQAPLASHRLITKPENGRPDEWNRARARSLKGGLDAILSKAISIDPANRYESFQAMAADIRRTLENRPVSVMNPTLWYRLGCYIRRKPIQVVLALFSMTLMVLLTGVSIHSAMESAIQVTQLQTERDRANEIKNYVASIIRSAHPAGMGPVDVPAGDLLQIAADRLDTITNIDPETRIELMTLIAESLVALRGVGQAEDRIDKVVDDATLTLGETHPLTLHALAAKFQSRQLPGELLADQKQIKALPALMAQTEGVSDEYRVMALSNRVFLAFQEWEYETAFSTAEQALAHAEQTLGATHPQTLSMLLMVSTASRITQRHEDAVESALTAHQRVFEQLKLEANHPLAIKTQMTYGMALAASNQMNSGLEQMRQAVTHSMSVFGPQSQNVAFNSYDLARYLRRAGHLTEAIKFHRIALNSITELLGEQSKPRITMHANLTRLLIEARQVDEAMIAAELLLSLVRESNLALPYHVDQNAAYLAQTMALINAGRYQDARGILRRVDADRVNRRPGTLLDPVHVEGILNRLSGHPERALTLQRQTLDSMTRDTERSRNLMQVMTEVGLNQLALDRLPEAKASLTEALDLFQQRHLDLTPRMADAMLGLARVHLANGQPSLAQPLVDTIQEYWSKTDPQSPSAKLTATWHHTISEHTHSNRLPARIPEAQAAQTLESIQCNPTPDLPQITIC